MKSVNKVTLIGNVGKTPEIRSFQNGGRVANFSLATSDQWTDKTTGEKKEKTECHTISVFSECLIKVIEKYVFTGSKLYLEGRLETTKYQDSNGVDRYSTEVVLRPYNSDLTLLDGKKDGDTQPAVQTLHTPLETAQGAAQNPTVTQTGA